MINLSKYTTMRLICD